MTRTKGLKPCPFCGAQPQEYNCSMRTWMDTKVRWGLVSCRNATCCAKIEAKTLTAARAHWNKRAKENPDAL